MSWRTHPTTRWQYLGWVTYRVTLGLLVGLGWAVVMSWFAAGPVIVAIVMVAIAIAALVMALNNYVPLRRQVCQICGGKPAFPTLPRLGAKPPRWYQSPLAEYDWVCPEDILTYLRMREATIDKMD